MPNQTYNYSWQNPVLRESIYPFRKKKLIDFLMTYKEIDLWAEAKGADKADSKILEQLQELNEQLTKERARLQEELNKAIEEKKASDKWFAAIRETASLKFKQLYYLDREIERLQASQARLEEEKNNLLKRVDWYTEGDTRRQMWKDRAKEKDAPIGEVTVQLEKVRYLRGLFDKLDALPEPSDPENISITAALRWQILDYQQQLESKGHDELLKMVLERFANQPERFERWLQYMVIHFSGMRYRSAHGSWADPKFLLELLTREFIKTQIQAMSDDEVTAEVKEIVEDLEVEKRNTDNEEVIKAIDRQIAKLGIWNRKQALIEYRVARRVGEIQNLSSDEKVFLAELVELKKEMKDVGDPMPDWVWTEVEKYTSLRLQTQEKDWEDISPDRYKWENRRWAEILNTWERKDITGWRKQHEQTLELIVTRAVCNEVAEHIQHLRGNQPGAGLTSKPKWYINMQSKTEGLTKDDPEKCYLVQGAQEKHFKNGASILWLDWVDRQPNAWQIALPLKGYDIPPGVSLSRRKAASTTEWSVHGVGASYQRTRRKPTIRELRKQGKTEAEIEAIRDEMRRHGGFFRQYLRWTHEATVVDVVEMLDGKFVLTFETDYGTMGLTRRRLNTLQDYDFVFVGYVPKADQEPDNLDEMLDADALLLKTNTSPPGTHNIPEM